MDIYGEKVNRLIGELGRLPGIGGKTAQRLAFHIINMPEEQVESLSAAITDAKKNIRYCKSCYTITDQELCPVCASPKRNHKLIMVVETPRDLAAYERVGQLPSVQYHRLLRSLYLPSRQQLPFPLLHKPVKDIRSRHLQ